MMRNLLIILSLALGLAHSAVAGDAAAGKNQTMVCGACHGADGNSAAPTFPKLAGQGEKYLVKQLRDIRDGARPVPTMAGQLTGKSDEDLADIAAFYASQAASGGQADPALVELGARVYRGGVADRGVAACSACHGARGGGNAPAGFPALAGQHADYIADQLRKFRSGAENSLEQDPNARVNDGDTRMMRDIAAGMSDNQIKAVASFVAGLH
jgi:cytochrome c553